MATHAEPATSTPARDLSPYRTDYTSWKILALDGLRLHSRVLRPVGAAGAQHARRSRPARAASRSGTTSSNYRLPIMIGMSVCLTMTAFYMVWSVAVARVMERVEGPGGVWSKLEMMGGTITCAPIMTACASGSPPRTRSTTSIPAWRTCSTGWAGSCSTWRTSSPRWQIAGASIVFMRDKREKKLVPNIVSWWGWITILSFFVVSAIPFVNTGPLCLQRRDQLLDRVLHLVLLDPGAVLLRHQGHPPAPGRGRGSGTPERLVSAWGSLPPSR